MTLLARVTQKLFGINAGANQMAKYGTATTTKDTYSGSTITPTIVQSMPAFLEGLYSALGGAYSPTIQDQNSLWFTSFYQHYYALQSGIPEWDSGTTYYINNFCRVGNILYYSLINDNLSENPVTETTKWRSNSPKSPTRQVFRVGSGTYFLPAIRPLYLKVEVMGPGGGGSGGILGSGNSTGTDGGDTTFGSGLNIITARGGKGGKIISGENNPGAGGIASATLGFGRLYNGQYGDCGNSITSNEASFFAALTGGNGGQNLLGGAGNGGGFGPTTGTTNGRNAIEDSGAGGGGGSIEIDIAHSYLQSGCGGGSGAYLDMILNEADLEGVTSFPFSVGAKGIGGSAVGASAGAGGNGADGIIVVTEYYQ